MIPCYFWIGTLPNLYQYLMKPELNAECKKSAVHLKASWTNTFSIVEFR